MNASCSFYFYHTPYCGLVRKASGHHVYLLGGPWGSETEERRGPVTGESVEGGAES